MQEVIPCSGNVSGNEPRPTDRVEDIAEDSPHQRTEHEKRRKFFHELVYHADGGERPPVTRFCFGLVDPYLLGWID